MPIAVEIANDRTIVDRLVLWVSQSKPCGVKFPNPPKVNGRALPFSSCCRFLKTRGLTMSRDRYGAFTWLTHPL